MNTLSYKTVTVPTEAADKKWVVVDAEGQVLGRLASKVAKILRGKYKPCFTPNMDCGDNVIIVNASGIIITGNKMTDKEYLRYTGYPGGQKKQTPAEILARPNGWDKLVRKAVKGMLPKNKLANKLMTNLYVYEGAEHQQQGQKPVQIDINTLK